MEQTAVEKKFGKYVMASMITMFLQSAYSMIDGLFVSNLIGDTALSAVNVAWPVIAVVTAIGTGVGCSGAVMMSTKQGEGKNEESNIVRANVILALLASSIVVTILFLVLLTPLLKLMGAEGELLRLSQIYGRVMLTGGVLQILSCGLTPLLRNDNRAVSAMMIMVGGLFANLGLDFVFMYVFHMGIGGAAGASLCAQLFTTLCCLIILGTKKTDPIRFSQFMIRKEYWKKIFKTAVSPFGISLTPSLLILYHNVACLKFGGDLAVNAYALISSTVGSYRVLLIGVAEGIQPLASYAYGAHDFHAIRKIRNKAIITAMSVSFFLFIFTIATAWFYPAIYGYHKDAYDWNAENPSESNLSTAMTNPTNPADTASIISYWCDFAIESAIFNATRKWMSIRRSLAYAFPAAVCIVRAVISPYCGGGNFLISSTTYSRSGDNEMISSKIAS